MLVSSGAGVIRHLLWLTFAVDFSFFLKNNKLWVVVQSPGHVESALDVAVDFMDEYADVFEELAK